MNLEKLKKTIKVDEWKTYKDININDVIEIVVLIIQLKKLNLNVNVHSTTEKLQLLKTVEKDISDKII